MRKEAHMNINRPSRKVIAGSVFAVLMAAGAALPTSYLVQQPGPVLDVTSTMDGKEVVDVTGIPTHDSDTHFLMTTVTSLGNAESGIPAVVVAKALLSSDEVVPVRALYPSDVSAKKIHERNVALMNTSQDTAAAVALEQAGLDVSMTLRVAGVPAGSPAEGVFEEGDILKAIETRDRGAKVTTFRSLSQVLDNAAPGSEVKVTVERDGREQTLTATTRGYDPDVTGWLHPGSALGVFVEVTDVKLPADVSYVVEGIGGPSAGLMFTLAIYDAVTPGSLGGHKTIAGTGAIAWDGDVEPIGGIRHKMAGARDAGATDFLAPASNCPETIGYEPEGLNVWAVRTIDEAIAATKAIGAGHTESLTPCSVLPAVER